MDRLELLKPLITPEVRKLADERLLTGEPLVKAGKANVLTGKRRQLVKIALLVVHVMNPWEVFGAEEEALLRGVSSDTIARRRNELKKL